MSDAKPAAGRETQTVLLSDYERELRDRIFANPSDWPDSAKVWIADYVAQNSLVPISQIQGWRQSASMRGAQAIRTTTETYNNTAKLATFEDTGFDTDSFWSSGTPKRLTVPVGLDGAYVIVGTVWAAANTLCYLQKNDETINNGLFSGGEMSVSAVQSLVAGDFIVMQVQTPPATSVTTAAATLTLLRINLPT